MLTKKIYLFCGEDPTNIENYEAALNDPTHVWKLHHRNEVTKNGTFNKTTLEELGLWYRRPASELIFLSKPDHTRLHNESKEFVTKRNYNEPVKFLYCIGKSLDEITGEDIDTMSDTIARLRIIYKQIKANCHSPCSHCYRYYGARGVRMCDEWLNDSDRFVVWAIKNGYNLTPKNRSISIVRKDKKGNYCPDNCYVFNNSISNIEEV